MILSVGSDHAWYAHKEAIKSHLESLGHTVRDHGAHSTDSMDYPDSAHPVCNDVISGDATYGILLCGTANGMAMTANKYLTIRAGLAWTPEIARLTREHNDANIVCIPARYTTEQEVIAIVTIFLETLFEWGRHQGRLDKMCCLE
jgi:ribose 5-phosphate isomerase B